MQDAHLRARGLGRVEQLHVPARVLRGHAQPYPARRPRAVQPVRGGALLPRRQGGPGLRGQLVQPPAVGGDRAVLVRPGPLARLHRRPQLHRHLHHRLPLRLRSVRARRRVLRQPAVPLPSAQQFAPGHGRWGRLHLQQRLLQRGPRRGGGGGRERDPRWNLRNCVSRN